ncbi:MAG TPA: class I tRNA ligase family protein, partial [Candidatus Dormibacteraeota bacterium]|nr:class I tRNA ligase family protein [Candidatus Dormibacteraeota bacterium]
LVFPHHECEIAQAEAIGPRPFARHWAHVAMVRLDGEKMSKSLGNLVFTRDLARTAGAGATRLLLAAHHWRRSWEYDPAELAEAAARMERYHASVDAGAGLDPVEAAALEREFLDRLDDDLDTPGALATLDRIVEGAGTRHAAGGAARVDILLPRLLDLLGAGFALGVEEVAGA